MPVSWKIHKLLTRSHSLPSVFTSPLLSENTSAIVFISIAKFELIDTLTCDEKKVWSRKLSLELSLIEIHFALFTKAGSFSFDINCLSSFSFSRVGNAISIFVSEINLNCWHCENPIMPFCSFAPRTLLFYFIKGWICRQGDIEENLL